MPPAPAQRSARTRLARLAVALVFGIASVAACTDTDRTNGHPAVPANEASTASPHPSGSPEPSEDHEPERPAYRERCPEATESADERPLLIRTDGGHLYGVTAGTGPAGVLLLHGSGSRGLCVWTREIAWLARAGYRVLAIDQACVGLSSCPDQHPRDLSDLATATARLKGLGAARVALVAASAGGPTGVHFAAYPDSGVSAVVALSPAGIDQEVDEGPGPTRNPVMVARALRVPVLAVTAADDSSVSRTTLRAMRAAADGDLVVDILPAGAGHAQETLYGDAATGAPSSFRSRMLRFLATHLGR